jgi:hypothetical protein
VLQHSFDPSRLASKLARLNVNDVDRLRRTRLRRARSDQRSGHHRAEASRRTERRGERVEVAPARLTPREEDEASEDRERDDHRVAM